MEDVILVSIIFGSMLGALKLVLDFVQSRKAKGHVDRSLTATELSEMIDESVERSLAKIERRIEHLEAIVVDEPVSAPPLSLEAPDDRSDNTLDAGRSAARDRVARRH